MVNGHASDSIKTCTVNCINKALIVSTGAHNLRFIDAADRTGLYTVEFVKKVPTTSRYRDLTVPACALDEQSALQRSSLQHPWHCLRVWPMSDSTSPFSNRFPTIATLWDSHIWKTQSIFTHLCLLCILCPSATEFSAILFLLFARSSSNSPRSFQRFRRTLRQNFNWIRQRIIIFPIDPHCKNWPLSATL